MLEEAAEWELRQLDYSTSTGIMARNWEARIAWHGDSIDSTNHMENRGERPAARPVRELQSGIADYWGGGQLNELPHHHSQPLPLLLSKFFPPTHKRVFQWIGTGDRSPFGLDQNPIGATSDLLSLIYRQTPLPSVTH